jgi:LysR family transcriptional regulator for metE and metH
LVAEYQGKLRVVPVRLGRHGIAKQIFLGLRATDVEVDYIAAFTKLAKSQRKPRRAAAR